MNSFYLFLSKFKKIHLIVVSVILLLFLNSCGIWDPADARKISPNADERVKKNLEEGKGFTLMGMGGEKGSGAFQFASSNIDAGTFKLYGIKDS